MTEQTMTPEQERVISIAGPRIDAMFDDWQTNGGVSPDTRDSLLIVAQTALAYRLPETAWSAEALDRLADEIWEKQSDNTDPDYEALQTGKGIAAYTIRHMEATR